jgi:16S rRNA (adenine1518-N6/adenine1519-N6)-dimethyltransferase
MNHRDYKPVRNENMRPKKHLGQHFLTAPAYARRIAEAVPASDTDHILEIGPGQGALSIFLKQRFPGFHLVEVDADAIVRLKDKLGEGEFTIHNQDVLEFDFEMAGFPLHVVGNLPYSIGALIIKKTLLYGSVVKSCTFMVQREVAERIVSPSHKKTNGFLTIFCGFFGKPELLFHVPPGAFFPRPNVDSSVFRIVIKQNPEEKLERIHWISYFAFVSKGFSKRRKMLVNVLSEDAQEKERLSGIISGMGLSPTCRPEDLDCKEWLELYKRQGTIA